MLTHFVANLVLPSSMEFSLPTTSTPFLLSAHEKASKAIRYQPSTAAGGRSWGTTGVPWDPVLRCLRTKETQHVHATTIQMHKSARFKCMQILQHTLSNFFHRHLTLLPSKPGITTHVDLRNKWKLSIASWGTLQVLLYLNMQQLSINGYSDNEPA